MKKAYIFLAGILLFPLASVSAQKLPLLADLEPIEHVELPPVKALATDRAAVRGGTYILVSQPVETQDTEETRTPLTPPQDLLSVTVKDMQPPAPEQEAPADKAESVAESSDAAKLSSIEEASTESTAIAETPQEDGTAASPEAVAEAPREEGAVAEPTAVAETPHEDGTPAESEAVAEAPREEGASAESTAAAETPREDGVSTEPEAIAEAPREEAPAADSTVIIETPHEEGALAESEAPGTESVPVVETLHEEKILPRPERRELEIAGADHALTAKYRKQYMSPYYQKVIIEALERSVPYRPYIREKLKEKGLPLLLQYLPIVESHYTIGAVSYAGATGMWQFMANSMAPLLSRNTWFDERRDPWKSTDAAALKLSTNYEQFKDWAIAIAAYNCGSGAMARAVRQNKGKDFWYMAEHGKLKSQSAQYVPKLLAIADLIENAAYYGLDDLARADKLIEGLEPEEFDYLTTTGMYSLRQISELSGISESVLKKLNPALIRNCTPARIEYKLRLPKGSSPQELSQKLKASGTASDAIVYTVSKGDTLWGISKKYKLTVADLCLVNEIKENNILRINQKLIIPVFD